MLNPPHKTHASCPSGQHQNWPMFNSKTTLYCSLQVVDITGNETSIKFSSRGHSACPSTLLAFQHDHTSQTVGLGTKTLLRLSAANRPCILSTCPISKSRGVTNAGTGEKGGETATQDPAQTGERCRGQERSGFY